MKTGSLMTAIAALVCLTGLSLLLIFSGAGQETVLQGLQRFETLLERHYWPALAGFTLVFAVLVCLALPVGTLLCLAAGYLFGPLLGAPAAALGATAGALVTLAAARSLGGETVERWLAGRSRRWQRALEGDAFWYLVALRIIPVAPFFVINVAAGLTRIGPGRFTLATLLGMLPIAAIYATIGAGLDSLVATRAWLSPAALLDYRLLLPLVLLAGLLALGWIFKRRLGRRS